MEKKADSMKKNRLQSDFEEQKLELIRMRIKNKYYDREEILQKVVQEIYEKNIREFKS